jgi:O-antigen/teichoic acid export membrane protein
MAAVARLAVQTNRYCFLLFLPPLLLLGIYADPLFRLWISPEFAAQSAPMVPLLAAAACIAVAGQQNTSAILYGLGAHKRYAQGLLAEAVLGLAVMVWAVPKYGIYGVAAVAAVMAILFRGLLTPWLICRRLDLSFAGFMGGIYALPLALGIPVCALAWGAGLAGVDGSSWLQLFGLGAALPAVYYGLAYRFALLPEHRQAVVAWAGARLGRGSV